MNKVKINVCGINYSIITDNETDFVMDIAAKLDKAIRETMNNNPGMDVRMASVFCALEAYEKREKSEITADNLRESLKNYMDENAKLRESRDDAAREADNLRERLEKLEEKEEESSDDKNEFSVDAEQLVLENTITPVVTIPVSPSKERDVSPPKPNRASRRKQNQNKMK